MWARLHHQLLGLHIHEKANHGFVDLYDFYNYWQIEGRNRTNSEIFPCFIWKNRQTKKLNIELYWSIKVLLGLKIDSSSMLVTCTVSFIHFHVNYSCTSALSDIATSKLRQRMIVIKISNRKPMILTNFDVFRLKMPLANVDLPLHYLFSETCVDNSLSCYNVQWRLSPASFLCFCQRQERF